MLSTVAQALLIWCVVAPFAAMSIGALIHAGVGSEPSLVPVKNYKPDRDRALSNSDSR
jgi:hypothetical protein